MLHSATDEELLDFVIFKCLSSPTTPNIDPVHMATGLDPDDCLHCIALWTPALADCHSKLNKNGTKAANFLNCFLFSCTDLQAASVSGPVNSIRLVSMSWIRCP